MPDDWRIEETHEDLLRVAHYVMTSPWEDGTLDDWIPSRKRVGVLALRSVEV